MRKTLRASFTLGPGSGERFAHAVRDDDDG
jgi:hypothetical protein